MNKTPIVWPFTDAYPPMAAARAEWEPIVNDYENNHDDMYLSWLYLGHHPMFWDSRVTKTDAGVVPVLDFSSAWNRPECLEINLERDSDNCLTVVVLDVMPNMWPGDPDNYEIGFSINGRTHEDVIVSAAQIVHDKYGNDRQHLTDDDGRWYG